MIIQHKTQREARWTSLQLQEGGIVAEVRRGPARGSKKFWWLVETTLSDQDVIDRLAKTARDLHHYMAVCQGEVTRLQEVNVQLQAERDNTVAALESIREAANG